MARSELRTHRKFKRLVKSLSLPVPYVVGLLECLWQTGYQSGSDLLGDATDVELCAEWPGEPGMFCAAALDCGFIERRGDLYHIHDLKDHAPEYVKKKLQYRERVSTQNKELGEEMGENIPQSAPNLLKVSAVPNLTKPNPTEKDKPAAQVSAEPAHAASAASTLANGDDSPVVLVFPTIAGRRSASREWQLRQSQVDELQGTFPALDVPALCREALGWAKANPSKQKTAGGMARFLWNWMQTEQNKGLRQRQNGSGYGRETPEQYAERLVARNGEHA